MTIRKDEIRNVAKIFEAFARAIAKRDLVKIQYLDEDGEERGISIDINKNKNLRFSFDSFFGFVDIRIDGDLFFNSNVNNIQSVTTFRTTQLKFHEVNKK